ncbi:hypothetical protein [Streptomyces lydicus]|uniref:hypothetical protein n=1 Tax=Streptomyces lydicus TaxID=47763 RepID=UPI0036CA4388
MNKLKKSAVTLGAAALAIAGTTLSATPASAADTGTCYTSKPCMYFFYNTSFKGAYFIAASNISNLGDFNFNYGTTGKGKSVKNNAASAKFRANNSSQPTSGAIFANSGYAGPCDLFGSLENHWATASKLAKTYNNNASVRFYPKVLEQLPSGCKRWN